MTTPDPIDDVWTAAVWVDGRLGGTGVVIDERRVLTCAHVVGAASIASVRLALPHADPGAGAGRAVESILFGRAIDASIEAADADVALLTLADPVPLWAVAPVKCPRAFDLQNKRWWTFGFPLRGGRYGDDCRGLVGIRLAHGIVRLDPSEPHRLEQGFSGAGVWCHEYESVVGIVVHADPATGAGRALTFQQADAYLPGAKLAELDRFSAPAAGEPAMAAWGWALATDPEGIRHWRPRARGVSVESERGYRFRGREAALKKIVEWLDQPARERVSDRRVLVVTGSPGVGKSAVLGRIVTTADAQLRGQLPADDAVRATAGSVSCAVHAKGKTALDVATEIARAASAALPEQPRDAAPALRSALHEHTDTAFNVIVDALDEATSPEQARQMVVDTILPLAQTCADVGVRLVIGARRRDDGGELLAAFGGGIVVVDLDTDEYFEREDLIQYALASLQLSGSERPGNPYHDPSAAGPVATRIADLASGNFLLAGLTARHHGLTDTAPVNPDALALAPTIDAALASYIRALTPVGGVPAATVLTGLAYVEPPGLTVPLWQVVLVSWAVAVTADQLVDFAHRAAANFLIESGRDGGQPTYRLFHQALNDALLRERAGRGHRAGDEILMTRALIEYGVAHGWSEPGTYLLRALPDLARRAGLVDMLLTDDAYLLQADLFRLAIAADHAQTDHGRARARLLHATQEALAAGPADRASMLSVTRVLLDLDTPALAHPASTYRAAWASVRAATERTVLEGHAGGVNAVCPVQVGDRQLLASSGNEGTIRLWDPATGAIERTLDGHTGPVNAVCPVQVGDRQLLASASDDGTIRLWDPATGTTERTLSARATGVNAMSTVWVGDRQLLASADNDRMVRLWDPTTGTTELTLDGHTGPVNSVCPVQVGGRQLLASASDDRIWLWDPVTGATERTLNSYYFVVKVVCPVQVGDRQLLASAGEDRTIRLWDPATGAYKGTLDGHTGPVNAVCPVQVGDRQLLASASDEGTIRLWDPATGVTERTLGGYTKWVRGLCPVQVGDRQLLASASGDGRIWLWDPATGAADRTSNTHSGSVNAVCSVQVGDRQLLASSGNGGTIRLWDPATGAIERTLDGHTGPVNAVCPVQVGDRQLLASSGNEGTIRLWDPATGTTERTLSARATGVNAMSTVWVGDRQLLASAGNNRMVRLWDPTTGTTELTLDGHTNWVRGLCPVQVGDRQLLASASDDGTIRLWDPATGTTERTLNGHTNWVQGVCPVQVGDRQLLASASKDRTIRLWDPATGTYEGTLDGHTGPVNAVCPVQVGDRQLLASASDDGTIRLWDLVREIPMATIRVRRRAFTCVEINGIVAVGLETGVLAVKILDD